MKVCLPCSCTLVSGKLRLCFSPAQDQGFSMNHLAPGDQCFSFCPESSLCSLCLCPAQQFLRFLGWQCWCNGSLPCACMHLLLHPSPSEKPPASIAFESSPCYAVGWLVYVQNRKYQRQVTEEFLQWHNLEA